MLSPCDRGNLSLHPTSKFFFKCSKGHQYESYLNTAIFNDCECLICKNVLIQAGINDLLTSNPELAEEFSPNEVRKPEEFTKDMSYSILWRCPKCSGDYKYSIKDRELHDDSCPYCSKRIRLSGVNTIEVTNKKLAAEWSPNNTRSVTDFFETDTYYAYWICPVCSGEYGCRICDRKLNDDKCSYCNGNKVLEGLNSLYVKHQELMKEWDYKNNYLICNPDKISEKSSNHVWWKCVECKKSYILPVKKRVYFKKRN